MTMTMTGVLYNHLSVRRGKGGSTIIVWASTVELTLVEFSRHVSVHRISRESDHVAQGTVFYFIFNGGSRTGWDRYTVAVIRWVTEVKKKTVQVRAETPSENFSKLGHSRQVQFATSYNRKWYVSANMLRKKRHFVETWLVVETTVSGSFSQEQ